MSLSVNKRYEKVKNLIINLTSNDIIQHYNLNCNEIKIMQRLYNNKYTDKQIYNFCYYTMYINQIESYKLMASLRKKGLIFAINYGYDNSPEFNLGRDTQEYSTDILLKLE